MVTKEHIYRRVTDVTSVTSVTNNVTNQNLAFRIDRVMLVETFYGLVHEVNSSSPFNRLKSSGLKESS